ncbi:MAG: YggS family pyridoxal phosphate-dependent enzyme [Planctomycetes bacterium]|nr:YggS family pyridoxal phosphate-dependent enzyme [Planctomycetota bacterium]
MNDETKLLLRENLERVRNRIASAAVRAGRAPSSVALVAITKSVSAEIADLLFTLGAVDLGENRVQELLLKSARIPGARWHLVGPLQSNKIRKAILHSTLLHAVDDGELLPKLQRAGAEEGRVVRCLLEVNVSAEATKHGIAPDATAATLESARDFANVQIAGLMTMAPANATVPEIRNIFRTLRNNRDACARAGLFAGGGEGELSMGMSGDYEIAVEEGATLVRVGSALFDKINTPSTAHP